jgi:hypothetical protein
VDNRPFPLNNRGVEQKDLITVAMVASKATLIALAYALPALLSGWWRQRQQERIARLNLLFGWTVIGWVVLLGYVVIRRMRASRGPSWRYRSRGRATTEHQRAIAATSSASGMARGASST